MSHGLGKVLVGLLLLLLGLYLRMAEHNLDGGLVWPLVGIALVGFGGYQWGRASLGAHRQGQRVRSHNFSGTLFVTTIAALTLLPILASADLIHSYVPYFLLRLWMVGFAVYGVKLSNSAGGWRTVWVVVYSGVGCVFAFVWGLEAEQWWSIDYASALLVALSAAFLRTEPRPSDHATAIADLPSASPFPDYQAAPHLPPSAAQHQTDEGSEVAKPFATTVGSPPLSAPPPSPPSFPRRTRRPRTRRMGGPPTGRPFSSPSLLSPEEAALAISADEDLIEKLWQSTLPHTVSDPQSLSSDAPPKPVTGIATVPWELGLCGERSVQVVKLASRFRSVIMIHSDDTVAHATSISEVMMLAATEGTQLQVTAHGSDASHAVAALLALFRSDH